MLLTIGKTTTLPHVEVAALAEWTSEVGGRH
jgi:hypothetical protein